jgi:hypothetical protein
MTKITPDHLARSAYVYIRQSTADQSLHNAENRRRQYALQERARQLGWADVVVIDHDPGPVRLRGEPPTPRSPARGRLRPASVAAGREN